MKNYTTNNPGNFIVYSLHCIISFTLTNILTNKSDDVTFIESYKITLNEKYIFTFII